MGSYVFRWPYPANDVHVTGTFDDWGKSEQLLKVGDHWEKEVNLPSADEKVLYKFVVDDQWIVDDGAPKEGEGSYVNNVLLPEHIKRRETSAAAPGAFPETPQGEEPAFGVAPIPASSGAGNPVSVAPGEKVPESKDVTTNTIDSTVTTSKEDFDKAGSEPFPGTTKEAESYSVNPIPASSGIGNPVQVAPGEKVPDAKDVTTNTIGSTVTTSQEDYEKAGSSAFPAAAAAGVAAGLAATGAAAASAFKVPEEKKNLIPESSLPMGGDVPNTTDAGPFISSSGPGTTTADLASKVPLEQKRQAMIIDPENVPATSVPEPVVSSIAAAHTAPEAASSAEAVQEKSALEKELLSKVPTSNATGEPASAAANQSSYHGLATNVPKPVEESIGKAHAAPEAAADTSMVAEKAALEKELLSKVPSTNEAGEPAPTIAAATSETAPGAPLTSTSSTAAAATALTDGKTANESGAATDTSTTTHGLSAGEIAGGAAVGGVTAAGVAAAVTHRDADSEPPRIPDSQKPAVTTERSPAEIRSETVPADHTLADEPAVKMMNQNEAGTTATGATTNGSAAATSAVAGVPTMTSAQTVSPESADKKTGAPATTGTAASAPSTPAKKTTPQTPTESPADSTATDKKKKHRHRISGFFKKVFN